MIKEKKHRLPLESYRGRIRANFTLCFRNRTSFFIKKNKDAFEKHVEILKDAKEKYHCLNWVYVFMPDHVHLILEGKNDKADLWKAMVLFKQKSGYWLSQQKTGVEWVKDFYDHIHRKEADLEKHIRYILGNPVRAQLVDDWRDYPFKGSLDFPIDGFLDILH